MTGERGGVSVRVFDLTTVWSGVESGGYTHRTIVFLPAPGLPHFDMARRSFLMRGQWAGSHFEPTHAMTQSDAEAITDFTRQYVVHGGWTGENTLWSAPQGTPEAEQAI